HHDAVLGRGGDVDVVHPDPGPPEGTQDAGPGLDHGDGDLDPGADDDALVVRRVRDQLRLAEAQLDIDSKSGGLEQINSFFRNRVADEDAALAHGGGRLVRAGKVGAARRDARWKSETRNPKPEVRTSDFEFRIS